MKTIDYLEALLKYYEVSIYDLRDREYSVELTSRFSDIYWSKNNYVFNGKDLAKTIKEAYRGVYSNNITESNHE